MTWQTEMTTIVRYLINDVDSVTFTDARIQNTITVSAQLENNEIDFGKDYTIDIAATGITPDPTVATKDDAFVNIVSLKAGCLITDSEIRTAGANLVRVGDGPSSIDMTATLNGLKIVYADIKAKYDAAKLQYQAGGTLGEAVLSPYSLRVEGPKYRSW